jgi:spermidine synthase
VTYNEDGRMYLARHPAAGQAYDLIMGDAFNDFSVPYHLTTKEFNDRVRSWLAEDGLYAVNIIDGAYGRFLRAYIHTMQQTFRYVYVSPTTDLWREASRTTFVVVASDTAIDLAALKAANSGSALFTRHLLDDSELDVLQAEGRQVMLTDRYAPVDQMLAPVFQEKALQWYAD